MHKKARRGSGRLKAVASDVPDVRPRRALPFHVIGLKSNPFSVRNVPDDYPCVHCGRVFKFLLDRPAQVEGKCMVPAAAYEVWEAAQDEELDSTEN